MCRTILLIALIASIAVLRCLELAPSSSAALENFEQVGPEDCFDILVKVLRSVALQKLIVGKTIRIAPCPL